ncbi:uncharacterized protein LOC142231018 [Haematobia irritans]|uniref:uncharacterized protein LOC142231018 n=1 Tax=Haematobia irritans TaxID=7368 RepID=UPI003F4FB625
MPRGKKQNSLDLFSQSMEKFNEMIRRQDERQAEIIKQIRDLNISIKQQQHTLAQVNSSHHISNHESQHRIRQGEEEATTRMTSTQVIGCAPPPPTTSPVLQSNISSIPCEPARHQHVPHSSPAIAFDNETGTPPINSDVNFNQFGTFTQQPTYLPGTTANPYLTFCHQKSTAPPFILSIYDGSTPWDDYERQVEDLATFYQWTEKDKLMAVTTNLRDRALRLYGTLPLNPSPTFEQVRKLMKERFSPDTSTSYLRFRSRMQGPRESIEDFALELERLSMSAFHGASGNVIGEILKHQFIDGLRETQLQGLVIAGRPKNLAEALRIAQDLEAQHSRNRPRQVYALENDQYDSADVGGRSRRGNRGRRRGNVGKRAVAGLTELSPALVTSNAPPTPLRPNRMETNTVRFSGQTQ